MMAIIIASYQTLFKTAVQCQSITRNLQTPFPLLHMRCLHQGWRKERKLPKNPNASGILTDKPDYSFLDGRPAPLGMGVKRRLEKQQDYARTIVQLSKEMDFAMERYNKVIAEKEEAKQRKLSSKLKPKGHILLKQK